MSPGLARLPWPEGPRWTQQSWPLYLQKRPIEKVLRRLPAAFLSRAFFWRLLPSVRSSQPGVRLRSQKTGKRSWRQKIKPSDGEKVKVEVNEEAEPKDNFSLARNTSKTAVNKRYVVASAGKKALFQSALVASS